MSLYSIKLLKVEKVSSFCIWIVCGGSTFSPVLCESECESKSVHGLNAVLSAVLRVCRAEVGFRWFLVRFNAVSLLVSITNKSIDLVFFEREISLNLGAIRKVFSSSLNASADALK